MPLLQQQLDKLEIRWSVHADRTGVPTSPIFITRNVLTERYLTPRPDFIVKLIH